MNSLMTSMYLSTPNSSQPNSRAPSAPASPARVVDDDLYIIDRGGSSKKDAPVKKKTGPSNDAATASSSAKYALCPRCQGLSKDFNTCTMCLNKLPEKPEFHYPTVDITPGPALPDKQSEIEIAEKPSTKAKGTLHLSLSNLVIILWLSS